MDWFFGQGAGGREGLTASAVTIFQGDRLSATVREVIQNSLDAGSGGRVSVGISLALQSTQSMPGIVRLFEYLEKAFSEVLLLHGLTEADVTSDSQIELPEDVTFYRRAIEIVKSDQLPILGFHDWGTTGLYGPTQESPGQLPGPWLALVRGQGVNLKTETDSLGSYGQGSKAPVSLSRLRTLFYLTRIEEGLDFQDRFIGRTLLSSMWLTRKPSEEPYLSGGLGYFAASEKIEPFLGPDIPAWASQARLKLTETTGTSVFIPAPFIDGDIEDFERLILFAVLLNFYFAIEQGSLEVTLPDGSVLNQATLREATKESGIFGDDSVDEGKIETLRTLYFAQGNFRGTRRSRSFGDFSYAIRVGENLTRRSVGIARKTGMLISRKPPKLERFPGLGNFDLFVCVTDSQGSKVLRATENPQHDQFEFQRISDVGKREEYEAKYATFAEDVRTLIKEFAELESRGRMTISDLSSLLGTLNDETEGDFRVEFPTRLKVMSRKKRSKHDAVGAGQETFGPSGSGGSGSSSRAGSGGGEGEANGDGLGSRGKRLRQATEPLLEVDEKNGAHHLFFTIRDSKKVATLAIFESGETGRESIRFSLSPEGPLVGEIPRETWTAVGTGKHRYRVDFFPETEIASVEAWVGEEEDAL